MNKGAGKLVCPHKINKKMRTLTKNSIAIVLAFILIVGGIGDMSYAKDNYANEIASAISRLIPVGTSEYSTYVTSTLDTNGEDFRIITFTDTHINGITSLRDFNTIAINLINQYHPQLVLFCGDNIDEWNGDGQYLGYAGNLTTWKNAVTENGITAQTVAGLFRNLETKWCVLMGNHDRDDSVTLTGADTETTDDDRGRGAGTKQQNDFYMSLVNNPNYGGWCLYNEGMTYTTNTDGYYDKGWGSEAQFWFHKYGDYVINIMDNGVPIYSIVMMDSGQHNAPGDDSNGYISAEQVQWYVDCMKQNAIAKYGEFNLEKGYFVPSMVFMHQPTPDFTFISSVACDGGTGMVDEVYGWGIMGEQAAKEQREYVNFGMHEAMKLVGGTDLFVGHNHGNNATFDYDGVGLHYLNRTGHRDGETSSWPMARINYSKMITIKADTHELEIVFALPDGTTTTEFLNSSMYTTY